MTTIKTTPKTYLFGDKAGKTVSRAFAASMLRNWRAQRYLTYCDGRVYAGACETRMERPFLVIPRLPVTIGRRMIAAIASR